jgi:hypothetical protein
VFELLPAAVQTDGGLITVLPVFFSHGVNEMQTLANKIGENELQVSLIHSPPLVCKQSVARVHTVRSHGKLTALLGTLGPVAFAYSTRPREVIRLTWYTGLVVLSGFAALGKDAAFPGYLCLSYWLIILLPDFGQGFPPRVSGWLATRPCWWWCWPHTPSL